MDELLIAEIVVRLNAIRALLSDSPIVSETYVSHFNDAIRLLESALEENLASYSVASTELKSRRAEDVLRGHCDRALLVAKIEGAIEFIKSRTRQKRVATAS